MPAVLYLPGTRGVLAAIGCPPAQRPAVETRAGELAAVYAEAIGRDVDHRVWWHDSGGVWALADRPLGGPVDLPLIVWGAALHGGADPDGAMAGRVLSDPAAGGELAGIWAIAGPRGAGLRCVTSSSLVRTLVHASHRGIDVYATRGLTALALAGAPLQVVAERIPELVRFDFVLGADELLAGTRVLEEAAVIDIAAAATMSSWSPRQARLSRGEPSTAEQLAATVQAVARQGLGHPAATLGLTAGLDSMLVARCAAQAGVRPRAFTFGWRGNPDVEGALEVAAALSLEHELAGVAAGGEPVGLETFVRAAPWGEAQVNPRPLAIGAIDWDVRDRIWATGHGGELGRAFYWGGRHPRDGELDAWVAELGSLPDADPGALAVLHERLRHELERAVALRGDLAGGLDGFYALGRMHKWTDRILPFAQFRGTFPVLLEPGVVRCQLDLPEDLRRDSGAFKGLLCEGDDAIAALAAARFAPPPPRPLARRAAGRALRLVGLRRQHEPDAAAADWPLLEPVLAGLDERGSVSREVLGDAWWAAMLDAARGHAWAQTSVWNAVAADALALALPDLSRRLEAATAREAQA